MRTETQNSFVQGPSTPHGSGAGGTGGVQAIIRFLVQKKGPLSLTKPVVWQVLQVTPIAGLLGAATLRIGSLCTQVAGAPIQRGPPAPAHVLLIALVLAMTPLKKSNFGVMVPAA